MATKDELKNLKIPKHVAIIMDGNGRWATGKGKSRQYGHKTGSKTLETICDDAYSLGIQYMTVYAFSTENWIRPAKEVHYLMHLLRHYLKDSIKKSKKDNIRIRVIGNVQGLDNDIIEKIQTLESSSSTNTGLNLQIALNYGGRNEIIRSIKKIYHDIENNQLHIEDVNEELFNHYLDTQDIPDPDLLIRTSGEWRISNFLLWQLAYTEFYFIDKHWPDFTHTDLIQAIKYYNSKHRRYGGLVNEA